MPNNTTQQPTNQDSKQMDPEKMLIEHLKQIDQNLELLSQRLDVLEQKEHAEVPGEVGEQWLLFINLAMFPKIPIEYIYGLIAVAGGIARYANSFIAGKPFKISVLFASAFVAGFSGYMFAVVGISLNLPLPMQFVMAGVGGFFGEQTMKLILEYAAKRISWLNSTTP